MSTNDDDLSSGINGRLRPRKAYISSLQTVKTTRRLDPKTSQERSKRVTTPSKALLNKPDDLSKKSDCTSVIDFLCPYCDKSFLSKQAASKHARRLHLSNSKQDTFINCLYCKHTEAEPNDIVRHMIDSHPNQYFACLNCHTRFSSTTELAEHKLNVCERQKLTYRSKLRKKTSRASKKSHNIERQVVIREEDRHGYNGLVISCELKPTHVHDGADIEDNITTNLILPPGKNLANKVIDKNAVIVLDDLQWNKRISHNFSFHNTDADQILSRLGVVHRSPRTAESTRKDWFKAIDDASQKFERCFDTCFYSKVASNVQENLSKFLDGSFNFNPDPNHTIKTRKAKNSVPINTVEGFPILLSCEQYSRNLFDGYMPRAIAPKHKWKWENLENDRNLFNADIIKRDSHVNNCIVTLVSSLDIWTQLCMRRKFEEKFKNTPIEKKTEKRNIIGKELKEILESRQLPISTSHVSRNCYAPTPVRDSIDFPASLGLIPTAPKYEIQPAVLSGEWVRPRCYVCCACGAQTRDPRALSTHISSQHPNAQVQHYEIAGELLLNADILKHLYVPPSPVHNRTRPLRGFRECTKCNKSITLEDLHQHMLDCAGDTPLIRRRCRYRQFGVRKRRSRISDNRIRKKIRKEIQGQNGRPRPKIRTEVGDAETIRKMLADLPAKRQRVMINPLNSALRPRRKIVKQRNQLTLKRRSIEDSKNRKTNIGSVSCSNDRPENNDPNKINKLQDENRSLQSNRKRVQNQLSRRSEIMNKKTVRKTRRKIVRVTQNTESDKPDNELPSNESPNPELSSNKVQIEQLSFVNLSNKVDVNSGSYNAREQANKSNNNGSNNRDNQNPDRNDRNGNSHDQGAPAPNIPLKHSIARLTADSDTQDKAVQFHHLFLVQQECNNVTQHVPSGQPVLFENKTVATKLDKPPLNVKDDILDYQNTQKGKSNKPRKGLNDCIAMLKNKLVEPNDESLSKAPNVSIQCSIDEQFKPSSQDVRKTIINSNRIDITVQCPETDISSTDTIITPRRRQSINTEKIIANLPTIGEYIKQNPDILIKHKGSENLNCNVDCQSIEPRKHVSETKLSTRPNIQQAITQKDPATNKTPRSSKQSQICETSERKPERTKKHKKNTYPLEVNKCNEVAILQNALVLQTKQKITESEFHPKIIKITTSVPYDNVTEKKSNYDKQNVINPVDSLQVNQEISRKAKDYMPEDQMKSKKKCADIIPLAHCNTNIESISVAPLDLSGKLYAANVIAHCSKQNITYDKTSERYETLDLSKKQVLPKEDHEVATLSFNDEVVDLRVKHITTTQSADSSLYSETNSATDLSLRITQIDCTPTDLSIKGKAKTSSIYGVRKEDIIPTESFYNTDVMPSTHKDESIICLNLSAKDAETPTDLSTKSICVNTMNSNKHVPQETTVCQDSRMCINEDKNNYFNPSDLSCQGIPETQMGILEKNNALTIQPVEVITKNYLHTTTMKTTSILKSNNMENSGYEDHERYPYQSPKAPFNAKLVESVPNRSYVTTDDVAISLTNKQHPIHESSNTLTHRDNSHEFVTNTDKGTYSLANMQSIAASHSHQSTNVEYSKLFTCTNNEYPILTDIAKTTKNRDKSLVSSSKLLHETNIYSSMCEPTIVITPEPVSSVPSTSYADKQKVLDKNILGHKPKCASILEHTKSAEVNDKVITTTLDPDPETAKKIAMLPKELVEILGNMPIDHRNQLLNVLPQYVSTSTSPTSTQNIKSQSDETKHNSFNYSNMSQYPYSGTHKSQQSPADAFQLQHSTANCMKSHNTTNLTKSIVDGSHLLVSIEETENTLIKTDIGTNKLSNECIISEDRIIDLTDDKNETLQPSSQNKENKNLSVILKPVAHKTNNEKTASLRAVRIKAPSERQKSMIMEIQFQKTFQDNNNTITLNNDKNNQNTPGPLAVQQFEISTTEEAKEVNSVSPAINTKKDCSSKNNKELLNLNCSKDIIPDINIVTSDDDNAFKLCCTSSTMVESVEVKNNTPMTYEQPDIAPSKSDITKEDESKHNQLSTYGDINLKLLDESKTELSINTPRVDNLEKELYEDDSEDDVSLAIIVKQKLKNQKSQNVEINETEKIEADKSHHRSIAFNLENRNGRGGSCNKKLNSIDIGHDIIYDDTKEKHSKKIKRSRRNMDITMPKVANDHFINNQNEFDVNKENTVNSDDTQLMKHHDCEQVTENNNENMNCAVENDNLSIDNDTVSIHHGKEKGKLKEKSDLSKDVNHITCNSEKNNQQRDEENSNVIENNMKIKKQHPYTISCKLNAENLLCASKTVETIESIENQTTAKSLSQINLQTQSSEKNFKNLTIQLENSVISSAIPQGENQVHSNSKFVNIHEINSMLSVNIASPQKDNLNTPLRRSRRGKSLFVENIDIFSDIKDKPDNEVDQRGPLTKKQLIFTKLLLDGDKSMNQINNAENNAVLQGDQNENDKSNITHLVSTLAVNTTSDQSKIKLIDKSHKRKQSPQTKKKLKRKKSSENVESFGEETLKITEISNHDSHISLKEQPLTSQANVDTEKILVGRNSVTTLISKEHLLDKSEDKMLEKRSKPLSFKRKSNNSNADILPSSIPKKSKSNIDNEKNESNPKEVKKNKRESDVHLSKVEVIQPHNNKPAARRGRSKSVFAKSSVSELYDPYDINLEDMATKNEPFIKKGNLIKNLTGKKINKNSFIKENEKNEENNAPSTSNIDNNNLNEVNEANIQVESVVETRGILSDSDDSSKSDIPLKKYVEDKERKKFEIKLQDNNIEEANKAELRKRNKPTLNYSDKLGDICQDENQERIRSEQFMESFGFFSERKPRKSNLLATKKISETFHIIANEKDDTFYESRDKSNNKKGVQVESRKSPEDKGNLRESISSSIKKVSKRGRKKKISTKVEPSFCDVCRKEFHRPDNFLRHQMTLAHATRVSEADAKVKSYPMKEGSNYLVIYKQQLDRLRMLQDKITRRKKYCKSLEKIVLPTLEEIIADLTTTVKQQQLARRGLSRDEALFLDCCELLNASRKDDGSGRPKPVPGCNNCFSCAGTSAECLNLLEKRINESLEGICDDGDVDSITAQDILESEEVRNLENDLISGLKEAACANTFNGNNIGCAYGSDATIEIQQQSKVDSKYTESPNRQTDETKVKCKKVLEVKQKMYPDVIENIDMFEDKFDKIKRKCRSQAAKQTQYVETSTSHKTRKKVDKKKRKKSPKKNHHSSVPTKGALKGFDGVKVSISTSDIDISSILPPSTSPLKKKRKNISKRKRERNNSGTSICDSDQKNKDPHSKLDVYEFMDNEDAELFEFRPSTLMERFKSIGNKDMPSTSRSQPACNDLEVSSESGSDGDDFVYMSDDYVCSDAETENSLMSCELGQVKGIPDPKKSSTLPKRKETTEKNAVMGKIFKHNAVRTEKKIIKTKVQLKPKANLDQLFDSLLEEEPNSSILAKTSPSPKHENYDVYNLDSPSIEKKEKSRTNLDMTSTTTRGYEDKSIDDSDTESLRKVTRPPSPLPYTTLISTSKKRKSLTPPTKIRLSSDEKRPSTSKTPEEKNHIKIEKYHKKTVHRKKRDTYHNDYDDITSKRRNTYSPNYDDDSLLRVDDSLLHTDDSFNYSKRKSKQKEIKNKQTTKSSNKGISTHFDYSDGNYDHSDDTGVARQRARRKCTVGKQNVLAETWSSESEPDGMPPRPSSADSVVVGVGRKRKGKKKEGQPMGGRKGNNRQVLGKKHEFADITHSNRNSCDSFTRVVPTTRPNAVGTSSKKARSRSPPYYWSDDEAEQEHVQQHGWIVGDSHKKLVTMLAHAKGKRNNEDKRHLVE